MSLPEPETVGQWFEGLSRSFNQELSVGLEATCQFRLSDGDLKEFWISIARGELQTGVGRHPRPMVTVAGEARWCLRALLGQYEVAPLARAGRLVLEPNDPMLVALVAVVLRPTRATIADLSKLLVGVPSAWQGIRDFQIAFLKAAGLRPHHRLLEIGCGVLRGGLPIIAHLDTGHYDGVDVRPMVLTVGRRELECAGLTTKEPRLHHVEDIARLDLGPAFDFVWSFNVLGHMTDAILDDCVGAVRRHLSPGGVFYGSVKLHDLASYVGTTWLGFPLVARSLDAYRALGTKHGLHLTDVAELPFSHAVLETYPDYPNISMIRYECRHSDSR